MPTTRSQAALQRAASDAAAPSANRNRQRSQTPALQQTTSYRRRQTLPPRPITAPENENRQQNERSPSVVELPRDTPPGQQVPVPQNLATQQNVTIDLTIDSSPDQTPEPEPARPRPRQTARMTTGGCAPRTHPRTSTGGIAPVRRIGRPPKPTAHMNSGEKRTYPLSDSSAEEDDEEFPIIKELEDERKKQRSDDSAAANAAQTAITCPICFDDSATIAKEGRQMMSTVCGHVFCSTCVKGLFDAKAAECPKCRKKIKSKQVHPIFL